MYTPFVLDKTRNLRYGMVAISLIEDSFGKCVDDIEMDKLTMKNAATVLWAGLHHEDNTLTPQMVMELVDKHSDIKTAIQTMLKGLADSFGDGEKKEPKARKPRTSQ